MYSNVAQWSHQQSGHRGRKAGWMYLQQRGFPLTKTDLATVSIEYLVVQQLRQNVSPWYELDLNLTSQEQWNHGQKWILQTTTTNTTFCSALECQTPGTECQNPAPACLVELDAFFSSLAGGAALPLWLLWATKPRYVWWVETSRESGKVTY